MKNLKSLTDYIKNNKRFGCQLAGDFDGVVIPVTDYGYEPKTKVFYLLCDFGNPPLSTKTILQAAHKYQMVLNIAIGSEELGTIKDVNYFSTEYGEGSFGESDTVVLH